MSSEYGTYFAESSTCGQKTQCSEQEVMAGDSEEKQAKKSVHCRSQESNKEQEFKSRKHVFFTPLFCTFLWTKRAPNPCV